MLSPMAGITDHAFRTFMRRLGAGVVVTELVSAAGIEHKSERTLKLMSFEESQRPVGIQLFGEDPTQMAKAATLVQEMGADFVDLNFGCPVPKVVKKGAGSAMLKDLAAMKTLLSAVVEAVDIPVTIKIRTGWDSTTRNAVDVCHVAYNEGIAWVAIHGRTRAQNYSGFADWDFIADVKSKAKLPILGNGDIQGPGQAVQRLRESGCDGVLIGRGALKNPYIFQDAVALWKGQSLPDSSDRNFRNLFIQLYEILVAHCDDHITQIQLKKFAAWFATGYPNAAQFRKHLFQSKAVEEIMASTLEFFATINNFQQEDTSGEAFLMGGHG